MSKVIIVTDERPEEVEGGEQLAASCVYAPGATIYPVDATTPLETLVGMLAVACRDGGYRLIIICHGAPGELQLCSEGLTDSNLDVLKPLAGLFGQGVLIDACNVAGKFLAARQVNSDARYFCSKMAQVMKSKVEASTRAQISGQRIRQGIDYLVETRWQGKVLTWDASGAYLGSHHGGKKAAQDQIYAPPQ